MEKKVEIEVDGRIVRCMPSMLEDMARFGAVKPQRVIKDVPVELLSPIKMEKAPPIKSQPPEKKVVSLDYDIRPKGKSTFLYEVFDSAGKIYNERGLRQPEAEKLLKTLQDEGV